MIRPQKTTNPNCTYCGLPILRNAEVEFNGKPFHPSCFGEIRTTERLQRIKEKELAGNKQAA